MTIRNASSHTPASVLLSAILSGPLLISLTACSPQGAQPVAAAKEATSASTADDAENVKLVGYNDMQGRQGLQLTAKSDPANGNWLYV